MKNLKLHTFQIKKQEYKKHLERLSHIYQNETDKKKILNGSRSVDKLMAITHRIHETSNKFRQKHKLQTEKLTTSRDWNKVNCTMLTTSKRPFQVSSSLKEQKLKTQQKVIDKENRQIFFRLMKVKPTIQTQKISYQFNQKRKIPLFCRQNIFKPNKTDLDFSSILNSSIIKQEVKKKILIRLHNQNQQVIKIRFSSDVKEVLNSEKIYFFEVKNNKGKVIESQCFSVKQLIESEVCILKKRQQKVELIQVKQLFHQMKTIEKGRFYIENKKDGQTLQNQMFILFIFPNNKFTSVGAKIQIKNLKIREKKQIVSEKSDNNLGNLDINIRMKSILPEITQMKLNGFSQQTEIMEESQ